MPKRTPKSVAEFQKLYLHHYGKSLSIEESEKRLNALVRLLKLVRDVPDKKEIPEIKLKFNIKNKPTPELRSQNTPYENLSEPKRFE